MRRFRYKRLLIVIIMIGLLVISPLFQAVKSYVIMFGYSQLHSRRSFLAQEGVSIRIPGGLTTWQSDYYPFVITYDNSEWYSQYKGEAIDLVILYNFGAFDLLSGNSSIYDPESDYYSCFYGAYAARFNQRPIGSARLDSGSPEAIDEVMAITDFDIKKLVLESVGCQQPVVDYQILNLQKPETQIIDDREFKVYQALLQMNGMAHRYQQEQMAYIQYGRPRKRTNKEDFEQINAYARMYVFYDEKNNINYLFYIIAPSQATLKYTAQNFIENATITNHSNF